MRMVLGLLVLGVAACSDKGEDPATTPTPAPVSWNCVIPGGEAPDSSPQIGCEVDFVTLSADPLTASIPGATSVKTVVDRSDENTLYFMNSARYPLHYNFASVHLGAQNGLPPVGTQAEFVNEYYSPTRRFVLGAITRYDGPGVWVYEISPYDTADAGMIELAYTQIAENAYFGDELLFHPTSKAVEAVAADLPASVPIITTDELFAGIDYQPLNLASSIGTTTSLVYS